MSTLQIIASIIVTILLIWFILILGDMDPFERRSND